MPSEMKSSRLPAPKRRRRQPELAEDSPGLGATGARPLAPELVQPVPRQSEPPLASLVLAVRAPAFAQRFSAVLPAAGFGMEFASAQRPVVRREEREARWRLELAETRTHPFQSAKILPACL